MHTASPPIESALLVVGHPGHELRVHGWLERAQPLVMVFTDGSGHVGASRVPSTAELLRRVGASRGSIFGRLTDAALYQALLDRNVELFITLTEELAEAIVTERIAVVAGDDAEGYNPTHDVCRLVVDAAVTLARTSREAPLTSIAFALMDRPDRVAPEGDVRISRLVLDDAALTRKLEAARRYPEMASEVAAAREAWGDEAFRVETFRHVPPGDVWTPGDEPPFYERHGARRVAAGMYKDVIRYDAHIRPLAAALAARTKLQAQ